MPKVDTKSANTETSFTVSGQGEIKKLITTLIGRGTGKDVKDLTISFSTAEYQEKSKRGEQIAELLKRTPNLTTLTLNFSGHLDTYSDCLGENLMVALCSLKSRDLFSPRHDVCAHGFRPVQLDETGFVLAEPPNSVSRWGHEWQRRLFNDPSSKGCNHPSRDFILSELSNAPRLQSIDLNEDTDTGGTTRKAFAEALKREDSFSALRWLSYPGERGTYKTGRGRNVRVHEYENVGAKELEEAARKEGVRAELAWRDLEHKVEGAQRRAGFAAIGRRGYW